MTDFIFYIDFTKTYLVFLLFTCICARRFPDEDYPRNYFEAKYAQTDAALEKLEHAPQWIPDWPHMDVKLGQVAGVALDKTGQLFVFHRATNVWDINTFNDRNVYRGIGDRPIPEPTILVLNETGEIVDSWGQNIFFIPHGITVDNKGNVWVTDVALHQVYKFTPEDHRKPALVLGEKFVPGDDDEHFCKPTSVAILSSGDFFVADGYCNTRIIKFAADGTKILQWGKRYGNSPFVLNVPHALTIVEEREVCAADREAGRVACFRADSGEFAHAYRNWLVGARIFSVAYAPVDGGRLYVVNGPTLGSSVPVRGYVIDYTSGKLLQTFAPDEGLSNPHDIAVTPDGGAVFVAELGPPRVLRFGNGSMSVSGDAATTEATVNVTRPKPTAVVEAVSAWGGWRGAWGAWGGAAGGALAAAGAALLAALCRARSSGRKSISRRRWEYGHGEFKLRRLLERRRFTRVHSDDSEDEPAPMLPPPTV